MSSAAIGLALIAIGCTATEGLPTSVPDLESISNTVRRLSYDHERTACVGCPDRWEPQACSFDDELQRGDSGLSAARCVTAGPMVGHREPPPALMIRAARSVQSARESLADSASRPSTRSELALQLYAFGADLQRLGSLEAWDLGTFAREGALDALEGTSPGKSSPGSSPPRGWPAELLALEASAPSPGRLLGIAIVDSFNSHKELDWRGRAGVDRASSLTSPLIRASRAERGSIVQQAELALEPARVGLPPARLPARLASAEAHRDRTHEVALNALLGSYKTCPERLESLGVPVGPGWTLEPERCRATPPVPEAQQETGADSYRVDARDGGAEGI